MTRGARTCRQQDDGLSIRSAPRQDDKTSADSHRAQRWRLRLASFLFASVLLADRLWLCAEATRTSSAEAERPDAFRDATDQEYRPLPEHTFLFLGNSSRPLRRLEACHPDSVSKSCFAVADAKAVCSGLSDAEWNLSDLYLPFCDSYSLLDLFYGSSSQDNASCGLDMATCTRCVQDYQSLDRRAQERYQEFELLVQKYETDVYSVRTCMDECTTVYKHWLCSQYFQTTQMHCSNRIPCRQYCLEVQQRCPFILPDNDELIYGGSPSFICTGLLEDSPSDAEAECCDVRWDSRPDNSSRGTLKRTHPSCQHGTSLSSSANSRLCNSRLKLCLLVLVLLHTVATITASHNLSTISTLEENSTNEE
ncbi:NALCN channel auxiliary factor 1 [Trichomycterus rosablanca]|uniref:NALCN channel auxiliary factor 1 n=1 Tax=Trichomycterus rosablanca TaxID=2290929 RepID=UPI002F351390